MRQRYAGVKIMVGMDKLDEIQVRFWGFFLWEVDG